MAPTELHIWILGPKWKYLKKNKYWLVGVDVSLRVGFEVLFYPHPNFLVSVIQDIKLSATSLGPCLPVYCCILPMIKNRLTLSETISKSSVKRFHSWVALVLLSFHNNRTISKTERESDYWPNKVSMSEAMAMLSLFS